MKKPLTLAVLAACMLAAAPAMAQNYPTRPVRIIAGTAAGGTVDKIARAVANHLSQRLGQPFVVENKAGAGGTLASELAAAAAPDGYTLSISTVAGVALQPVLEKVRYDPIKDFKAVGLVGLQPYVLLVPFDSKAQTVRDVVEQARANTGKFSYSSAGRGTGGHLGGELLSQLSNVPMLHVPYKGVAPAINDVVGGFVSVTFATTGSSQGVVEGKKLRPLATTGAQRSQAYPQLPTMQEAGFAGYELSTWYGLSAPAKTPAAIVALLNKELNTLLADKKVQEDFASDGIQLQGGSPEDFRKFEEEEQVRWRAVLEKAGLAYKGP